MTKKNLKVAVAAALIDIEGSEDAASVQAITHEIDRPDCVDLVDHDHRHLALAWEAASSFAATG